MNFPTLAFDPWLSSPVLTALIIVVVLAALLAGAGGLKSGILRGLAGIAVAVAVLNPQTLEEDREPINDAVLVINDMSESTRLGERGAKMDAAFTALIDKLKGQSALEVTRADIPPGQDGTRLAQTLIDSLGQLPRARLAGIITLTDGLVHDLPDNAQNLVPEGVPFHSLVLNDQATRDRRIKAVMAPRYGLVGEKAEFVIRVEDPGYEGEGAPVEIRLNGEVKARFLANIGGQISIPVEIERRGLNTVEILVQSAPDELTIKNNLFVAELSGIRDRMRVLLVTGAPHSGGRAWRNLLKSDPAVDLVHFTILTNPSVKFTNASQNELSLIQFPTRQLFEDKLEEFDLIIFDQFARRQTPGRSGRVTPILQPYYIQNIARYVENGGALLVATGPAYAGENSIFRSPLAAVLPARPTGDVASYSFRPKINDLGARHPVTAPFVDGAAKNWGSWFRIIDTNVVGGNILMTGAGDEPLMVIEKIGDGRVGMLLSDQAWLWSRGFEGGGPYNEMFRRLAHWLLGEPDLDAETLSATAQGENLVIERRTLSQNPQNVIVAGPDGDGLSVKLEEVSTGLYQGTVPASGQGAYRLRSGDLNTVAAIGALNPWEFENLIPTLSRLEPLSVATGGTATFFDDALSIPTIRRVKPGAKLSGENWMGLVAHDDYITRASRRAPLMPGWIYFLLAAFLLGGAWWREGR